MNNLRAHLKSNAHKMLNVSDAILDRLMPEPALPKPTRAVARRKLAQYSAPAAVLRAQHLPAQRRVPR